MADTFSADIYQARLGITIGSPTPNDSSAQDADGGTMRGLDIEVPGGSVAVGEDIMLGGQPITITGSGRAETYDQFLSESHGDAVDVVFGVDANGNQVMIFPDGVPDGIENARANDSLRIRDTDAVGYDFERRTPLCFVAGTRIRTPHGDVAVEELRAGDLVLDHAGVAHEIRWIGSSSVTFDGHNDRFRPVRIPAGSLGASKPDADLLVSPQHRVYLCDGQVGLLFGLDDALTPAKHLIDGTVDYARDMAAVTYYHVLCDAHVVLIANNLESESLLLGEVARTTLDKAALDEVRALFPELDDPERAAAVTTPAAPLLKAHEAALWRARSAAA